MIEFNDDFNAVMNEHDNILKQLVAISNIIVLELFEEENLRYIPKDIFK
jgi:hypothetical protein